MTKLSAEDRPGRDKVKAGRNLWIDEVGLTHAAAIKKSLNPLRWEFMSDSGVRPALKESSQRATIVSEDNGSPSFKKTSPVGLLPFASSIVNAAFD